MPKLRPVAPAAPVASMAPRALPERIQRLIVAEEDTSERLIGWVQLFVVSCFAVLFFIAPRPADAPMRMVMEPVVAALAVYALFTLGRLALSYRMRLPGALLVISIVADVGLLLWLIWTFHAQYGQTAPFSLKVPTFVYMFVFIALRVLRFDHRYVMVAGLTAAGGWLVLLAAVLALSEPDAITRNFVHYLSSNTILLGAEFDKVVTILLVTAVLSLAVARGRRLLVTAVREAAAVKDLRRFLGRGVSDRVVGAEIELSAGYAQERDAAIVMLDIRGFTPVSAQLPPAQVVELLIGLHARLIPIVRAHGGIVDKFLGDGVMATFGAVAVSTDAAAQALRALEAIMAEAARWRAELPPDAVTARLEVNGAAVAGLVVFAVLGSADRLEYTVIGEAVNLAAKLEKHNKVQGCRALTTLDTLARAEAQGYVPSARVEPLRACRVAGVAAPLDLAVISV